jgi:hypothetical protein
MNNEIREKIFAESQTIDGKRKLACAKAFEIAKKLKCSIKEIGEICEEENIKIFSCQLGCF